MLCAERQRREIQGEPGATPQITDAIQITSAEDAILSGDAPMSWFRENRFRGRFLVAFGVALLMALWVLFSAKSDWDEASACFRNASTELNRLERLAPYPSTDNLRKMKAHAEDYST